MIGDFPGSNCTTGLFSVGVVQQQNSYASTCHLVFLVVIVIVFVVGVVVKFAVPKRR